MGIAADLCIYTNHNFTLETLPRREEEDSEDVPVEEEKPKKNKGK